MKTAMSPAECCRILGVPTYASWEDIRQAYLDLVRVWHPDRFQSDPQLRAKAEQQVQNINEAYATLKRSMEHGGGPHVPPEQPPEPPKTQEPPRPPRRPFVLKLDRPFRMIGLLIACLIPIAFGLSLVNLVHTAAPDLDLINRRLERPAILSPSRILSPLGGLAVATANLSSWARGDGVDLWRSVPKPGEPAPAPPENLGDRSDRPETRSSGHARPTGNPVLEAANGAELAWAPNLSGIGELTLSNNTHLDGFAILVRAGRSEPMRAIYVQSGSKAAFRGIAIGVYDVVAELGTEWDPRKLHFRSNRQMLGKAGPFDFYDISTAQGRSGCKYELALRAR